MMLGNMEQLKVPDTFMIYITLFCSGFGYYPYFFDIIRISWISTFCVYYPYFVDISVFWGSYPHFVNNVKLSAFRGYYLYWSHYKLLILQCLSYLSYLLIYFK